MSAGVPAVGSVETEFGVQIPGRIVASDQWTRTGIKRLPAAGPIDWAGEFGRSAPLVVELGCGNGRYSLLSALGRPGHDHIGVDVLPVVIRYATRRGNQRGLANVRFAVRDAETFVREHLAPGSTAEVHIYHPQPFHDRKDWRRRLITPRFLADVHRCLEPDGLLVLQTDELEYWRYIRRVVPEFFRFEERESPWPDAPEGRSRREILARQKGFAIHRGEGRRRADRDPDAIDALVANLPAPTFRTSRATAELDRLEREPG